MLLREYRTRLRDLLSQMNPEDAPVLADLLLAAGLRTDRGTMLARLDEELEDETEEFCANAVYELSYGKPLQYVLGSCVFYGQEIVVGPGCFIPRSDTEVLVETALKILKPGQLFADLCSGSGCIAKAIAANRPDAEGYALELSAKAMAYTLRNLSENKNVQVIRFDALDDEDYAALSIRAGRPFDLLVCNPPYIPTEDLENLPTDVRYEPETALDGGEDGLRFYRAVTAFAPLLLKPDGVILFEIGYDQAESVQDILRNAGYATAVIKDYGKNDRVVIGKKAG
ncbi:MAG: peptide chain release factor N(5)-glutamine methyltransferase [Clostridia bacterium]|nr:peptide chain release factor N(5)-glutamine methyltransferase [Clostridia bacterium]